MTRAKTDSSLIESVRSSSPVVVYPLPLDFYFSHVQRIEKVTQADVR